MARTVADTPIRTTRLSAPESIDADLAALWRELADIDAPIARAVMSNLVVVRDRADVDADGIDGVTAGLPLDDVVARHPSRLIVVEHDPGRANPAAPFAAAIGVLAFGPPHARYGIEEIVVRSACAEASLPSIVSGLIRGDLPTSVWWTADLGRRPPLDAFVAVGRQLIYDSRDWRDVPAAVRALAPLVAEHRIDLADVNWRRLAPLRRAIAHGTTGDSPASVLADGPVRIEYGPSQAALGWLLAGWVLSLTANAGSAAGPPEVTASSTPNTVVSITFGPRGVQRTATLTVCSVVATRGEGSGAPLTVGIPIESDADAVAAELRTLSRDIDLQSTLAALVRLFTDR
jgi:hypothetical protein